MDNEPDEHTEAAQDHYGLMIKMIKADDEERVHIHGVLPHVQELRDATTDFADYIAEALPMSTLADMREGLTTRLRRIKAAYRSFDVAVSGA